MVLISLLVGLCAMLLLRILSAHLSAPAPTDHAQQAPLVLAAGTFTLLLAASAALPRPARSGAVAFGMHLVGLGLTAAREESTAAAALASLGLVGLAGAIFSSSLSENAVKAIDVDQGSVG